MWVWTGNGRNNKTEIWRCYKQGLNEVVIYRNGNLFTIESNKGDLPQDFFNQIPKCKTWQQIHKLLGIK